VNYTVVTDSLDGTDGSEDGGSSETDTVDGDDGGGGGDDGGGGVGDGGGEAADTENVQKAQDAWERFENNPDPDAEDIRTEAFVDIEEARRDDMILLPLYHGLTERFWYDNVDVAPTGALGPHYQKHNLTALDN
jgi:peptide/nickel transport system substrate-binding protein